jgi:hypothetical protein
MSWGSIDLRPVILEGYKAVINQSVDKPGSYHRKFTLLNDRVSGTNEALELVAVAEVACRVYDGAEDKREVEGKLFATLVNIANKFKGGIRTQEAKRVKEFALEALQLADRLQERDIDVSAQRGEIYDAVVDTALAGPVTELLDVLKPDDKEALAALVVLKHLNSLSSLTALTFSTKLANVNAILSNVTIFNDVIQEAIKVEVAKLADIGSKISDRVEPSVAGPLRHSLDAIVAKVEATPMDVLMTMDTSEDTSIALFSQLDSLIGELDGASREANTLKGKLRNLKVLYSSQAITLTVLETLVGTATEITIGRPITTVIKNLGIICGYLR